MAEVLVKARSKQALENGKKAEALELEDEVLVLFSSFARSGAVVASIL